MRKSEKKGPYFWGTVLPIFRLTFLESFCNFRQFGLKKNDGYFFLSIWWVYRTHVTGQPGHTAQTGQTSQKEETGQTDLHLNLIVQVTCVGQRCFYSNYHAAERWDSKFGSNTTGKFQNSLSFQIFHWVFKFFRGVWKPNSKSHLSAAWCLLLTPRHEPLQDPHLSWLFTLSL